MRVGEWGVEGEASGERRQKRRKQDSTWMVGDRENEGVKEGREGGRVALGEARAGAPYM